MSENRLKESKDFSRSSAIDELEEMIQRESTEFDEPVKRAKPKPKPAPPSRRLPEKKKTVIRKTKIVQEEDPIISFSGADNESELSTPAPIFENVIVDVQEQPRKTSQRTPNAARKIVVEEDVITRSFDGDEERVTEDIISRNSKGEKVKEKIVTRSPRGERVTKKEWTQRGSVEDTTTYSPQGEKVREKIVTRTPSGSRKEDDMIYSSSGDKVMEKIVTHTPHEDKIVTKSWTPRAARREIIEETEDTITYSPQGEKAKEKIVTKEWSNPERLSSHTPKSKKTTVSAVIKQRSPSPEKHKTKTMRLTLEEEDSPDEDIEVPSFKHEEVKVCQRSEASSSSSSSSVRVDKQAVRKVLADRPDVNMILKRNGYNVISRYVRKSETGEIGGIYVKALDPMGNIVYVRLDLDMYHIYVDQSDPELVRVPHLKNLSESMKKSYYELVASDNYGVAIESNNGICFILKEREMVQEHYMYTATAVQGVDGNPHNAVIDIAPIVRLDHIMENPTVVLQNTENATARILTSVYRTSENEIKRYCASLKMLGHVSEKFYETHKSTMGKLWHLFRER